MKSLQHRVVIAGLTLVAIGLGTVAINSYIDSKRESDRHADLPPPLDKRFPETGSLRDLRGNQRSLEDMFGKGPLVLLFLSVDGSSSTLYLPWLIAVQEKYRSQGVKFVAIFPNANETADSIAAYAHDNDIPFLVLQDNEGKQTRALGVEQTGEACVIDNGQILRYRGGIFADAKIVPAEESSDSDNDRALGAAIDAVLANRWVREPIAAGDGEPLVPNVRPSTPRNVTFTKDVAPILQRRCETCHRPGRAAPFSLLSFENASQWSAMIKEVVVQRRMPPWHADARYGHFRNDRRMSPEEVQTLVDWVDGGMVKGDPADEPKPIHWASGWSIGTPDVVIQAPKPFRVPATGAQIIDYSTVDKATTELIFAEDKYIQAAEVLPGAPAVVHHISVYVVWPGALPPPKNLDGRTGILGWAPGEPAYVFPEGSALWVPKGSTLVFEMHYTPNGTEVEDRSSVGLIFAKEKPQRRLTLISPGQTDLTIEPNEPNHKSEFSFVFPSNTRLLGLMGHMHLRGKAYTIDAIFPDGKRETLLSVPRYDFYWQTFYWLKEPMDIPGGTRLVETGWWDNSADNLNNPDPNAKVIQGPASFNEMLTCWMFLESES